MKKLLNVAKLTDIDLDQFFRQGYLILKKYIAPNDISLIAQATDNLLTIASHLSPTQAPQSSVIPGISEQSIEYQGSVFVFDQAAQYVRRIIWAGAAKPKLLKISRQAKIKRVVAKLLGSRKAAQLTLQIHPKLANDGVDFPWHQDVHARRAFDSNWEKYARNGKGSYVQAIIAIDAQTETNGPLLILPHSHLLGPSLPSEINGYCDEDEFRQFLQSKQKSVLKQTDPQAIILQPGDILFMHPWLWHKSQMNQSNQPRRTLVTGFAYPGANTKAYPGRGSGQEIKLVL